MLANRVLSESVCRLFPLLLSDVIDEDAVLHNRPAALSASVIGKLAMARCVDASRVHYGYCVTGAAGALSKLSQSLAPMIAFALLPSSQVVAGSAGSPTVAPSDPIFVKAVPESIAASADSANRVWALLLAIPSACVVLQVGRESRF